MKHFIAISIFIFFSADVFSQIWNENFTSEINGATTGNNDNTVNAAADWTTSCAGCFAPSIFRVESNRFQIRHTGGTATWTSESINITDFTNVGITVDVSESGNLENFDQITLSYQLNGGAKTQFTTNGFLQNDFTSAVASETGLLGTTLVIIIDGRTNNASENIFFDNITVTGTPVIKIAKAKSPFCGDIHISDTTKAVPLESQALIWLKSNKGTSTTTDGVAVTTWNDNTTNLNNVTQPTAGNRPTYRNNPTDNQNFNPTLEFVNDHLLRAAPGVFVSGTSYTHLNTYIVFNDKDATNFDWFLYEGVNGFNRFSFSANWAGGPNFDFDITTANRISGASPTTGITSLYSFNAGTTPVYGTASNRRKAASLNGTQFFTNNIFTGYTGTNNTFWVGNQLTGGDASNSPFDGYYSEILILENQVSLIYHQQIQTYLGIKYGLTLGHDYISPDTVVLYDISNGYANGIFGIGRSACFDLYQPKSKSESNYSGVTIEATIRIGDENYLMIGHDGGALTKISLGGETNVLTRKWYAKMTKGLGTINMELDLATVGANPLSLPANVKIGVSNSPAFTLTNWISATSVVGGVAYFTGIPLYNKYFTFSAP